MLYYRCAVGLVIPEAAMMLKTTVVDFKKWMLLFESGRSTFVVRLLTQVLELRQSVLLELRHSHGQRTTSRGRRRDVRRPGCRETAQEPAILRRLGKERENLLQGVSTGLGHQGQLQVGSVLRHQDRQLPDCRPEQEEIVLQKMERGRVSSCRIDRAGYA